MRRMEGERLKVRRTLKAVSVTAAQGQSDPRVRRVMTKVRQKGHKATTRERLIIVVRWQLRTFLSAAREPSPCRTQRHRSISSKGMQK